MRYTPAMRALPVALILLTCVGCVTRPLATYEELVAAVAAGEAVDIAELRRAFAAAPDFAERVDALGALEQQAMQIVDEEPLRLGPLGAAILDRYQGSVAGHFALVRFYEFVEREEAAREHRRWVSRIVAAMEGDGTREKPHVVLSAAEANAYLVATGRQPVGSIYQTSDEFPFVLAVTAKPAEGPMQNLFFDLGAAYASVRDSVAGEAPGREFRPGALIGILARRDDPAAQVYIGGFLFSEDRLDEAVDWLSAASRRGNLVANLMLARVHLAKAQRLPEGPDREEALELVMQNYVHAVAVGSDEAMYQLAELYIAEYYGPEEAALGIPLLEQAADLDNIDATLLLAQIYVAGHGVEADYDLSEAYFLRAAGLESETAKIQYARFLMSETVGKEFTNQAFDWLRELADDVDPCRGETLTRRPCPAAEARLLLGDMHARGIHVKASHRRARNWFKSAVKASPENARIVNEVAWWLTVTQIERLRDERYALAIMERMMTRDDVARRNPAYLDTWAAAYAANGNFGRAVALQEEALKEANDAEMTEVIDELERHLSSFQAGETITDPLVP